MAMRRPATAARRVAIRLLPLSLAAITAAPLAALGAPRADCAPGALAQAGTDWTSPRGEPVQVRSSALFSVPERQVYETRAGSGAEARTALSDGNPAQGGQVFAALGGAEGAQNALAFQLPGGSDLDAARLRLHRIEHLYAFVFRQPPQTRFQMPADPAAPQRDTRRVLPQPALLKTVAAWRECAAGQVRERDPAVKPRQWTVPVIEPVLARPAGALRVAARVAVRPATHAATTLSFAQGAHLACSGGVDAKGVGSCTLFDSHGHEEHDHGGGGEPLLITFGGSVEADRIVLPMTAIVPATRAAHAEKP